MPKKARKRICGDTKRRKDTTKKRKERSETATSSVVQDLVITESAVVQTVDQDAAAIDQFSVSTTETYALQMNATVEHDKDSTLSLQPPVMTDVAMIIRESDDDQPAGAAAKDQQGSSTAQRDALQMMADVDNENGALPTKRGRRRSVSRASSLMSRGSGSTDVSCTRSSERLRLKRQSKEDAAQQEPPVKVSVRRRSSPAISSLNTSHGTGGENTRVAHEGQRGTECGDKGKRAGPVDEAAVSKTVGPEGDTATVPRGRQGALHKRARDMGRQVTDCGGLGDCFFRSVCVQLTGWDAQHLREAAVRYLRDNPHQEFIDLQQFSSWDNYLMMMARPGEWADNVVIQAVASVIGQSLHIIRGTVGTDTIVHPGVGQEEAQQSPVVLGFIPEIHYVALLMSKKVAKRSAQKLSEIHHREVDLDADDASLVSLATNSSTSSRPRSSERLRLKRQKVVESVLPPILSAAPEPAGSTPTFPGRLSVGNRARSLSSRKRRLTTETPSRVASLQRSHHREEVPEEGDAPPCCKLVSDDEFVERMKRFQEAMSAEMGPKTCSICSEAFPGTQYQYDAELECRRCKRDRNKVKLYSKENLCDPGFQPPALANLTVTEQMLISPILSTLTLFQLEGEGQYSYTGHCIHFHQDVTSVAKSLPRTDLPVLIVERTHNTADMRRLLLVRKKRVADALAFLKRHHSQFGDIDIDADALESLPEDGAFYMAREKFVHVRLSTVDGEVVDTAPPPNEDASQVLLTSSALLHIPVSRLEIDLREAILRHKLQWPQRDGGAVNEFRQDGFLALAYPYLFPTGKGDYSALKRTRKLEIGDYFNHLMRLKDSRFRKDARFRYTALNIMLRWRALASGRSFIRQNPMDDCLTNEELQSRLTSPDFIRKVLAYTASFRGSRNYWLDMHSCLTALCEQLGFPTFFVTLSAADLHWPDLREFFGPNNVDQQRNVRDDPGVTDWYFTRRLELFIKDFFKGHWNVVGYWFRLEWQSRGSPHAHGLVWLEEAPAIVTRNPDCRAIEAFADSFLCTYNTRPAPTSTSRPRPKGSKTVNPAAIPYADVEDREADHEAMSNCFLRHTNHGSHCLKRGKCRFGYPQALVPKTTCAVKKSKPSRASASMLPEKVADKPQQAEVPAASTLPETVEEQPQQTEVPAAPTLPEIVEEQPQQAEVPAAPTLPERVEDKLQQGEVPALILLTKRNDPLLQSTNPQMLSAWRANCDVQMPTDLHSLLAYLLKYATKCETASEFFSRIKGTVVWDVFDSSPYKHVVQGMLLATLDNRDFSAQECMHHLLQLPMYLCSHTFERVNTSGLREVGPDGTLPNILDRYRRRHEDVERVSLFEFARLFNSTTAMGAPVSHRKKPAVVVVKPRLAEVTTDEIKMEAFYQQALQLHVPWRHDPVEVRGEFSTFREAFQAHDIVLPNKLQLPRDGKEFQAAMKAGAEDPPDDLFPSTAAAAPPRVLPRHHDRPKWAALLEDAQEECQQDKDDMFLPADLQVNPLDHDWNAAAGPDFDAALVDPFLRSLQAEFKVPLPVDDLDVNQLNDEQKRVYDAVREHAEQEDQAAFQALVMGCAGTGKSFLIHCIKQLLGEKCLLLAPTGVAACNIRGQTLHSSLAIPVGYFKLLQGDQLLQLQTSLQNVTHVIIDEDSMIGKIMLHKVDSRLRQAYPAREEQSFGGVNILLFGDFGQLEPVMDHSLLSTAVSKGEQRQLSLDGAVVFAGIKTVFTLDTVVRQDGDTAFRDALLRVRDGRSTALDHELFMTRATRAAAEQFPSSDALHLFQKRKQVDKFNLNRLRDEKKPVALIDAVHPDASKGRAKRLSEKASSEDAGGLANRLLLCEGARVMLRHNLCVNAGLVNGTVGIVKAIVFGPYDIPPEQPLCVLVEFPTFTGQGFMGHPHIVPIRPHTSTWQNGSVFCSRKQLPLSLAWSTTFHKSQGLTLNKTVVRLGPSEIFAGGTYVALSRVRQLSDLLLDSVYLQRFTKIAENKRLQDRVAQEARLRALRR